MPRGSYFACQALSFAESTGGLMTHLQEILGGLPIPEGDESAPHWIEAETPAEQVTLQEAGSPILTRDIAFLGADQQGKHGRIEV